MPALESTMSFVSLKLVLGALLVSSCLQKKYKSEFLQLRKRKSPSLYVRCWVTSLSRGCLVHFGPDNLNKNTPVSVWVAVAVDSRPDDSICLCNQPLGCV